MAWLIVLGGAGSVPIWTILLVRAHNAGRWQRELVAYELRFPRGLDAADVAAFFAGLSGLVAPRHLRPLVVRAVVLEVSADSEGITHRLLMPRSAVALVLSALRAALPGVVTRQDEGYRPFQPNAAVELGLSNHQRVLDVARPDMTSARLLASLQPLRRGECVTLQWVLAAVGPLPVMSSAEPPSALRQAFGHLWEGLASSGSGDSAEVRRAATAKRSSVLFAVRVRVGAIATDGARAARLEGLVASTFHAVSVPGAYFFRRRMWSGWVTRAMTAHAPSLVTYPVVLNAVELAALTGIPLGQAAQPGVKLAGARQLAPPSIIPSRGRVVAQATYPGAERPLGLSVPDSLRHMHVIGPTGVGKSTLLLGLITQDMQAGRGVVVIEPKGDLVADVLERVPAERMSDVIILDPADDERPVGLNLLAGANRDPELVADQLVGIFHRLYASSWGPRTADVLRSALLTLASQPGMTLAEVPLILTDAAFRRRLVAQVDDPIALGPFWGWFSGLSDAERAAVIGPVMNKLRAFLLSRRLRNVLGQARPHLDLEQALATRKILLVPLRKGLLGEEAAALVGSLVVARLWQAVQRRTAIPAERRPTTFAYIDEFQDYLNLPTGIADILAQARGLGLGLTLAHQHLGQLPADIREAVLSNARSRVMFQLGGSDARALARDLAPYVSAADLMGLGAYEVIATLSAGGQVAPPVTARTSLPPPSTGSGETARLASRERYGVAREEVEAEIYARHGGGHGPGPVGRQGGSL